MIITEVVSTSSQITVSASETQQENHLRFSYRFQELMYVALLLALPNPFLAVDLAKDKSIQIASCSKIALEM
jgi:hypothetical protein